MEICKLLDKLVDRTLLEFDCGLDNIDADECGKVIDKCSARSKAVHYIGYINAPYGFYDETHPHIYSDDMKIKAVIEWNRRCVKNDE